MTDTTGGQITSIFSTIYADQLNISATSLTGCLCMPTQSTITIPPSNIVKFYANSSNNIEYSKSDGYKRTLTDANTADRTYTFPDATGPIVLTNNTATLTNKTIDTASNTITVASTAITSIISASNPLRTTDSPTFNSITLASGSVLTTGSGQVLSNPKISGYLNFATGAQADYQYDQTTPVDSWIDITASITVKGNGANNPNWSVFRNGIYGYSFSSSVKNECWIAYHIPHNYAASTNPGTFLHLHWAPIAANPTGNIVWAFEYTYASSGNTVEFPASTIVSVVDSMPDQYVHKITEIPSSILAGQLEVDGIIIVHVYRDATNVLDTSTDLAFLFFADAHLPINKIGTKYRNKLGGSFYS